MICYECEISREESKDISAIYEVALCQTHRIHIKKILEKHHLDESVAQLYFALKKQGLKPLLGWWNGQRYVPLSLSRQRINLEILDIENASHKKAFTSRENSIYDHQQNFIHLQIPKAMVTYQLNEMASIIYDLHEGLKHY